MNRAILIVICDFLVSAMLTMMTGMVPGHSGGTGVGLDENTTKVLLSELDRQNAELEKLRAKLRETVAKMGSLTPEQQSELQRLTARLAENKMQQSKLRASLAATPENTGELDAKELQRRLEAEQKAKLELEIKLKDSQSDVRQGQRELEHSRNRLADTTGQLREAKRDLAVQRRELSRTRETLAKTSETLVDVTRENANVRADLARTEEKLESEQRETRRQTRELSGAKEELRRLNTTLVRSRGENTALQNKNANLTGQLAVREKNYAALQDQLAKAERTLAVLQLEKTEAVVQRDEMQKTVKNVVTELAEKERALEQTTKSNFQISAKLEAAREMLERSRKNVNNVIKCYGSAVVQVDCAVTEESIFGGRTGKSTSYYPLVDFNGKIMLVGLTNRFAGDEKTALSFKNITGIDFSVLLPQGNVRTKLPAAMIVSALEMRIAGFNYKDKNSTPLKLLTAEELLKRGLDGLYLFKPTSFGGSSAKLDGRVSLALTNGSRSLFIRNAGRANNELKSAPGDFILSSDGEFVGIVIANDTVDNVRGSRVFLFESAAFWNNPVIVPLNKLPGEKYFSRYAGAMQMIRRKVRPGYDNR